MALTPAQRTLRAQVAAFRLHAQGKTNTAPAREALAKRFLDEVDPDRTLTEAERTRRAKAARSAFYKGIALKSSMARGRRAS